MNNKIGPQELRKIGIPIEGLPVIPPREQGKVLFALITKADGVEFTVMADDDLIYGSNRTATRHEGDQGNWLYEKMALYFVPS